MLPKGEGENMIKNKLSILAAALLMASSVMATDWVIDGKISGTPHDLSGDTSGVVGADDNGELCVYCHTPHAANSAFDGAPLWNKAATAGTVTYRMYGASTAGTQGTTLAGTAVGSATGELSSSSLACLSCHDGVSAVNSIVNAPGSGMGTLAAPATPILITAYAYGGNIGDGNNTVADVDMANDHPVSVTYTEGAASLKPTTAVLTDWVGVNGTTANTGTIAEILRSGKVECGSCHDPHNGYATQGTDPQVNYLRHTNTASALCLGCHDKQYLMMGEEISPVV